MDCVYLNYIKKCVASPHPSGIYTPTPNELEKFCTNSEEMWSCSRLRQYRVHLQAQGGNTNLSNVNNNTNNNTNTNTNNSSSLNLDVQDALELAFTMVERKNGISDDEKNEINARIAVLEKELGKGENGIDNNKIERIKQGFQRYSWLVPTIVDIITKSLPK